jgi:hypothetical protein
LAAEDSANISAFEAARQSARSERSAGHELSERRSAHRYALGGVANRAAA